MESGGPELLGVLHRMRCTSGLWVVAHDCATGPVGTACADGTIYAGNHPTTSVRMYVSPTDDSAGIAWNNGSDSLHVDTAMVNCLENRLQTSCNTGAANTTLLVGLGTTTPPAPYLAARLCRNKGPQWYLPSHNELRVIINNRAAIGGFPATHQFYWSSSEYDAEHAMPYSTIYATNPPAADNEYQASKYGTFPVRCVRTN